MSYPLEFLFSKTLFAQKQFHLFSLTLSFLALDVQINRVYLSEYDETARYSLMCFLQNSLLHLLAKVLLSFKCDIYFNYNKLVLP